MNGCMCAIDIGGIGFGQVWTITLQGGPNKMEPMPAQSTQP